MQDEKLNILKAKSLITTFLSQTFLIEAAAQMAAHHPTTLTKQLESYAKSGEFNDRQKIITFTLLKILNTEYPDACAHYINLLSTLMSFDKPLISWVEQIITALLFSDTTHHAALSDNIISSFKDLVFDLERPIENKRFLVDILKCLDAQVFVDVSTPLMNQALETCATISEMNKQQALLHLLNVFAAEMTQAQITTVITLLEHHLSDETFYEIRKAIAKTFKQLIPYLSSENQAMILKKLLMPLTNRSGGNAELMDLLASQFWYVPDELKGSLFAALLERAQWKSEAAYSLRRTCFKQLARLSSDLAVHISAEQAYQFADVMSSERIDSKLSYTAQKSHQALVSIGHYDKALTIKFINTLLEQLPDDPPEFFLHTLSTLSYFSQHLSFEHLKACMERLFRIVQDGQTHRSNSEMKHEAFQDKSSKNTFTPQTVQGAQLEERTSKIELDALKTQIVHQQEQWITVKTFFQSHKLLSNSKVIFEFSDHEFSEFEQKNCIFQ